MRSAGLVTIQTHKPFGSFTLRAAITETATADWHIITDDGTWAIELDLISRTYSGRVRRE